MRTVVRFRRALRARIEAPMTSPGSIDDEAAPIRAEAERRWRGGGVELVCR